MLTVMLFAQLMISGFLMDLSHLSTSVKYQNVYDKRRPGCIQHGCHRRQLRSRAAVVKRTRTQFGKRAFSSCGPIIWNSLPPVVRRIDSESTRIQTSSEVTFIPVCFYCITFYRCSLLTVVIHIRPYYSLYDWHCSTFLSFIIYHNHKQLSYRFQWKRRRHKLTKPQKKIILR